MTAADVQSRRGDGCLVLIAGPAPADLGGPPDLTLDVRPDLPQVSTRTSVATGSIRRGFRSTVRGDNPAEHAAQLISAMYDASLIAVTVQQ